MGFGGKVDHGIHPLFEDFADQAVIANVSLDEFMTGVPFDTLQIFEIAGIGELVEVKNPALRIVLQHKPDEIGSDKSRSACDQELQHN
jgi:hypothetical protein